MTGARAEAVPEGGHHHVTAGPSAAGSVVLDLGAGVGAMVLYTPADLAGAEIEISQEGDPAARRTHALVRARGSGVCAAVYPGLAAGRYTVWRDAATPAGIAEVVGGQVTTWHWPG